MDDLSILLVFSRIYWRTCGFAGGVRFYRETCGFPRGFQHFTGILGDLLGELMILLGELMILLEDLRIYRGICGFAGDVRIY